MNLELKYETEDFTMIVRNVNTEVEFHHSEIHDCDEFELLTGKTFRFDGVEKKVIDKFYELGGLLL
jgi:hypothetical protein